MPKLSFFTTAQRNFNKIKIFRKLISKFAFRTFHEPTPALQNPSNVYLHEGSGAERYNPYALLLEADK